MCTILFRFERIVNVQFKKRIITLYFICDIDLILYSCAYLSKMTRTDNQLKSPFSKDCRENISLVIVANTP